MNHLVLFDEVASRVQLFMLVEDEVVPPGAVWRRGPMAGVNVRKGRNQNQSRSAGGRDRQTEGDPPGIELFGSVPPTYPPWPEPLDV